MMSHVLTSQFNHLPYLPQDLWDRVLHKTDSSTCFTFCKPVTAIALCKDEEDAMSQAMTEGHLPSVQILVQSGNTIPNVSLAIRNGHLNLVKWLYANKVGDFEEAIHTAENRSNGKCIADVRLRITRGTYVCSMSDGHTI